MTSIKDLIIYTLSEINEELQDPSLNLITEETKLFGADGALDSLTLVSLVVDLEEKIFNEFGINIILADEKAMSQRTSPFATVHSLITYIEMLLSEQKQ